MTQKCIKTCFVVNQIFYLHITFMLSCTSRGPWRDCLEKIEKEMKKRKIICCCYIDSTLIARMAQNTPIIML